MTLDRCDPGVTEEIDLASDSAWTLSFEEISEALHASGFVIERMLECRPEEDAKTMMADFNKVSKYPQFLAIKAKLV